MKFRIALSTAEQLVKVKKQKQAERKERKRQEKASDTIDHGQDSKAEYDDIPF